MSNIKIKDLNINLEELQKKDSRILEKIRGGMVKKYVMLPRGGRGGSSGGGGGECEAGADTMLCTTASDSGCGYGPDTMFCCTGDHTGCHPFWY
jgi:hypothetical protein